MKLSVMVTTYNLRDFVAETLDSILTQKTDFDYEILVGDDGSTDGTIDIVQEYVDKYPKKVFLYVMDRDSDKKYNRISRASRNRLNLLRHAKGEYGTFLDGDDVYNCECKLQKQIELLDAPEYRNCVACAHNIWKYWDENNKELMCPWKKQFVASGKDIWRDLMYFHSDTIVFRNIFSNEILCTIPQDYFDDNIILYSLLPFGNVLYIPEAMVNYRQVEGSSWNSVDDAEKHIINMIDVDVEHIMNPDYSYESVIRHMGNVFYLWRNRKSIPKETKSKFENQIKADDLKWAGLFVNYDSLSIKERVRLGLWVYWHLLWFSFNKARKTIVMRKWM
mgnify:FL=1